jgi:hypothetical protein
MNLTLEQHLKFGEKVKDFREEVLQLVPYYKKTSREHRAVMSALKHIDHMKHQLDNVVHRDFPKYENAHKIYYGLSAAWIAKHGSKKAE